MPKNGFLNRKIRRLIEERLRQDAEVEVLAQRPPYTCVRVTASYLDQYSELAFSKAQWPDEWDPEVGQAEAIKKALASMSKQVVAIIEASDDLKQTVYDDLGIEYQVVTTLRPVAV